MDRWDVAFYALCFVTLAAIGVGQSWPFVVLVPLLAATVVVGVVASTRSMKS